MRDDTETISAFLHSRASIERSPQAQQSPLVDEIPPEFVGWSCPECERSGYVTSTTLECAHIEGIDVVCDMCHDDEQ